MQTIFLIAIAIIGKVVTVGRYLVNLKSTVWRSVWGFDEAKSDSFLQALVRQVDSGVLRSG